MPHEKTGGAALQGVQIGIRHNAQAIIWIRHGVSSDKTKSYSSLKLLNSSEQVLLPGGSFSPRPLGRGD